MPTVTPPLEMFPDPDRARSTQLGEGDAGHVLASYPARRDPAAGHDEMVGLDAQGTPEVRAHWRTFVEELEQMGTAEIAHRWQRAQEQIHENGVSFNVY